MKTNFWRLLKGKPGSGCARKSRALRLAGSLVLAGMIAAGMGLTAHAEDVQINETNFPDATFREYVKEFDGDSNNILSSSELSAVYEISFYDEDAEEYIYTNIADLKGIEHFTFLIKLDCGGNQLTSLDISKNTSLRHLSCEGNQLTSLDVSNNIYLTNLYCYENELTTLDISKNKLLTDLNCADNNLTSLDVSNNTGLKTLYCAYNNISTLDSSKITNLMCLECRYNGMTSLTLGCMGDVDADDSYEGEFAVDCSDNNLVSVTVTDCIDVDSFDCSNNQLSSINFTDDVAHIDVSRFDCSNNNLTSLDFEKVFFGTLDCSNNKLTSFVSDYYLRDCSEIDCSNNNITSIDVSVYSYLENLYCNNNQITSLDVSNNTYLKDLDCSANKLTSLNVRGNYNLNELYANDNALDNLYLGSCISLVVFECKNNKLASIDLKYNYALIDLRIDGNNITQIDLVNNEDLLYFYASNNKITYVNLEENVYLQEVDLSNNNLTSLDLSENIIIKKLNCSGNVYNVAMGANRTFNLATLPGFNVSKVKSVSGASITGWMLKISNNTVKYVYDCGVGLTAEFTLNVTNYVAPATVGQTVMSGGVEYKVVDAGAKTISISGAEKSAKKVVIPGTIVINGDSYKVTKIEAKAFKGCKKLKSVTIGANVTKIGKNAFNGCKKLKKITIKSKKLSIGKNAFKGINKKATFKVPKKAYKKLAKAIKKKKTGYRKSMKVKK